MSRGRHGATILPMLFPIPPTCGPLLRLQVVVAHPGDETLSCGALLLHAAEAGAVTAVTCATRGGTGMQEAELREAARLLGVRRVDVLGLGEPAGAPVDGVLEALTPVVQAFAPHALVTLEAGGDRPDDHARVRDATLAVGRSFGLPVHLVGAMEPGIPVERHREQLLAAVGAYHPAEPSPPAVRAVSS